MQKKIVGSIKKDSDPKVHKIKIIVITSQFNEQHSNEGSLNSLIPRQSP